MSVCVCFEGSVCGCAESCVVTANTSISEQMFAATIQHLGRACIDVLEYTLHFVMMTKTQLNARNRKI